MIEWIEREFEFEKWLGFVIMVVYCMVDKKVDNFVFESFFFIIIWEVKDERIYVKKVVNWVFCNIGKWNVDFYCRVIEVVKEILSFDDRMVFWIVKDVLWEFEKKGLNVMGYLWNIYEWMVVNLL